MNLQKSDMTYTKQLSRYKYTQLDKKQRATYYLDFLIDHWEPNIDVTCIFNSLINCDGSCPDISITGHEPYKGMCEDCKWFLGIDHHSENSCRQKGCCGLKLHIYKV